MSSCVAATEWHDEDNGTACNKIAHVQHPGALSMADQSLHEPKFEVIALLVEEALGYVRRI